MLLISASAGASSGDDAFSAMQTTGSHIINYNLRLPRSGERDRSIYQISDLLRQDFDRIPEIDRYEVCLLYTSFPAGYFDRKGDAPDRRFPRKTERKEITYR